MSLLVKLQNVSNRGDGNTWIKLHISQFVYWGNHKLKPDCCSESKSRHTNRCFLILADHNDVVVTTYLVSIQSIPHSGLFWHHGSDLSQG